MKAPLSDLTNSMQEKCRKIEQIKFNWKKNGTASLKIYIVHCAAKASFWHHGISLANWPSNFWCGNLEIRGFQIEDTEPKLFPKCPQLCKFDVPSGYPAKENAFIAYKKQKSSSWITNCQLLRVSNIEFSKNRYSLVLKLTVNSKVR